MSKKTTFGKTPRPMSSEAIERAARADRDAQPLTADDLKRMKRTPQAKIIRRALERSEEHTSELQSQSNLVCRLLLEKKKNRNKEIIICGEKNCHNDADYQHPDEKH